MTVARFARNVRLGSLMLLLGLTSVPALAQPAGSPPLSREELLRLLAERDAAIITLQNRMRALEQRLAAPAPGPAVAATPAVPAETPAAPPLTGTRRACPDGGGCDRRRAGAGAHTGC